MPERTMLADSEQNLSPEIELGLAYMPAEVRPKMMAAFALDQRLGRIVAGTTEPMLGQMRLAWWRDMLGSPVADRPVGDEVLDSLGKHWAGNEAVLIRLVNAWEVLVAAEDLTSERLLEFAENRSAFWESSDGRAWAIADAASRISDEGERAELLKFATTLQAAKPSSKPAMRGFAVLNALARRALKRGGRPLMEGRGASIAALRAALFGR